MFFETLLVIDRLLSGRSQVRILSGVPVFNSRFKVLSMTFGGPVAKLNYLYFRHRLDAHQDPKMVSLRDAGGYEAWGIWWALLEIYGKNVYGKEGSAKCSIPLSLVLCSLNKRVNGLTKFLLLFEQYHLLSWNINGTLLELLIPNYPKYFGSYGGLGEDQKSKGCPSKSKSKSKSKIIKKHTKKGPSGLDEDEGKTKPKPLKPNPDKLAKIVELWNTMSQTHGLPKVRVLTDSRKKNLKKYLEVIPEISDWEKIIAAVPRNKFNLGENDRGWKADFTWLVRPNGETPMKLLELYDDDGEFLGELSAKELERKVLEFVERQEKIFADMEPCI